MATPNIVNVATINANANFASVGKAIAKAIVFG